MKNTDRYNGYDDTQNNSRLRRYALTNMTSHRKQVVITYIIISLILIQPQSNRIKRVRIGHRSDIGNSI